MKVYLESLGCKLNQSEVERMSRALHHAGHRIVSEPHEADICLLNSCAVTHTAAHKTRQTLRRLARENPAARLAVLGCYADLWPDELVDVGPVEVLAGSAVKEDIVGALGLGLSPVSDLTPATRRRTRAFVKVQDGCDNHCTYCVVRLARGRERSRPLSQILDEMHELLAEGVREIVLTGVHVGSYGSDLGLTVVDLVGAILDHTDLPRLRLSSLEPWHVTAELVDLFQDERLCRHLHMPLQSGCDATLRRMGRRYTSGQFAQLAATARSHIPYLALTTDVMVGFPGETEAEFQESLAFVRRMEFSRLHVFRYSRRPGTPAAQFSDQVPPPVSAARSDDMEAVGAESSRAFRLALLGQTLPVLWETRGAQSHLWSGLTDNYVRVTAPSPRDLHNCILKVRLEALDDEAMRGQLSTDS